MVSEATEQEFAASMRETPEGRAYYLAKRTGAAGYLVDARTERHIKRFLAWQAYVYAAVGVALLNLPLPFVVKLLAAGAAAGAIHHLALRLILIRCKRTRVPWTPRDPARSDGTPAYHEVYRAVVLFAAALAYLALYAIFAASIVDRVGFTLMALALVGYGAVALWRHTRRRAET